MTNVTNVTNVTNTITLHIRKSRLADSRLHTAPGMAPAEGQIALRVERFALTANNITYAAFGEAMQYWDFYPTTEQEWGVIPVWGFAKVTASRVADIAVGERFYGYYPMASSVLLQPMRVNAQGFHEAAAHRQGLATVYNNYLRSSADPFYRADNEDLQALLRPLYMTSWLIDDLLADNDFFGACATGSRGVVLLSSASSKTAYGTAFQLAQRQGIEVVGLTSEAHRAFCERLGCYHRVLSYTNLDQVAADAPLVYVDFAGNAELRRRIHGRFSALRYSCAVGGTHVGQLGGGKDLPGPKPTLFFAPAQIKKRLADWGGPALGQRLVQSWRAFVAQVGQAPLPWLRVTEHRGATQVQQAYLEVLGGHSDPSVGHMLMF